MTLLEGKNPPVKNVTVNPAGNSAPISVFFKGMLGFPPAKTIRLHTRTYHSQRFLSRLVVAEVKHKSLTSSRAAQPPWWIHPAQRYLYGNADHMVTKVKVPDDTTLYATCVFGASCEHRGEHRKESWVLTNAGENPNTQPLPGAQIYNK